MVRLNLEFYKDEIQTFVSWLNREDTFGSDFDVQHWVSFKEFSYKYMFNITFENCSFVFALGFNGNSEDRYKGFAEFNPNKCMDCLEFKKVLNKLFSITSCSTVSRFDLAIDIPVPKYLAVLEKDNRNYQYIKGQQSESEYLGRRSKPGFIKLYDKKAESNLDYDLTRLEITTDLSGFNFPTVKVKPVQQSLQFGDLNSTERVLVQLLDQVDNKQMYLSQLTYRKRKKIEEYLGQETLQFDKSCCYEILQQAMQFQF